MLNNWIVVSVIAGLASAAMAASVLSPSLISFVLFYLSPLPLFMAGLGWGPVSVAVAGAVGLVVVAILLGGDVAILFACSSVLAPVLFTRLALINRQPSTSAPAGEGEAIDQGIEWYPEGRLVLWSAGLAVGLLTLALVAVGPDPESYRAVVTEQIEKTFSEAARQMPDVDESKLKDAATMLVSILPAATASVWFLVILFNFWAGSRLVAASGHALRPWAPFHRLAFPRTSLIALAAFAGLALLPGIVGMIASAGFVVFLVAFTVLGLAVVHGLTLGNPMRGFMLASLYVVLAVMGGVLVLPLAGLAIMDMFMGLRTRVRPQPPARKD